MLGLRDFGFGTVRGTPLVNTRTGGQGADEQGMLDRLLADRAYRIRMIVRDNPHAVAANWIELKGQPTGDFHLIDTLINNADTEAVDLAIDVPFLGTPAKRAEPTYNMLCRTHALMVEQAQQLGDGDATQQGKVFPALGAVAGLQMLTSIIGGIGNGRRQREAEEAMREAERAAKREAAAAAARRKAMLINVAVGLLILIVIVALIVMARKNKMKP